MASSTFLNMKQPHPTEPKHSSTALISTGKNKTMLHATGYTPGDSLQQPGLGNTRTPLVLAHLCVEWTSAVSSKAKHELLKSFSLSVSLSPSHKHICAYAYTQKNLWGSGLTLSYNYKTFFQGCLLLTVSCLGHFSVLIRTLYIIRVILCPMMKASANTVKQGVFLFSLARTPTVLSAAAWTCGFWGVTSEKQLWLEAAGRSWLSLWPRPKFQSHILMNACWSNRPVWGKNYFGSPAMPSSIGIWYYWTVVISDSPW